MKKQLKRLAALGERIWPPEEHPPLGEMPDGRLFVVTLAAGLALGALVLRRIPLLGYDWLTMFHHNQTTDIYYPPWTAILLRPLSELPFEWGLGMINGITVASVAVLTWRMGRRQGVTQRLFACGMALASFQVAVVLWTGHIDGLALLAILALPWAAPLLLMKATFIGFAVISRRDWLVAALVFGVICLFVWPGWPADLLATLDFRNSHAAAGGWKVTGWLPPLIGLLMLANSRRTDPFQAMAAGAFLYPFLMPYHHIVLLPVLGTMKPAQVVLTWLAAWAMALPAGTGSFFWIYFPFPLTIWWYRRQSLEPGSTWLDLIKGQ